MFKKIFVSTTMIFSVLFLLSFFSSAYANKMKLTVKIESSIHTIFDKKPKNFYKRDRRRSRKAHSHEDHSDYSRRDRQTFMKCEAIARPFTDCTSVTTSSTGECITICSNKAYILKNDSKGMYWQPATTTVIILH